MTETDRDRLAAIAEQNQSDPDDRITFLLGENRRLEAMLEDATASLWLATDHGLSPW